MAKITIRLRSASKIVAHGNDDMLRRLTDAMNNALAANKLFKVEVGGTIHVINPHNVLSITAEDS